ncbi:FkbM family methyltransferase [Maridesulfovibrio sp.]|uniref:FkbM family methyltransferase n=1 Tax=Maridesulfovibrio sp. TaxID=2795000 RepID=UPI002A18CA00|nr:FkbM family methyltransferase [Maridesulfovibrio sp.]
MSDIKIRYIDHTGVPKNSRVCLYGVGKGGAESLQLLRQIRPDVEVVFFADTYNSGSYEGFEIIRPQNLVDRQNEFDLILVCSCYYTEIITNLYSVGIKNAVGFSWPKFYSYLFLPDELGRRAEEINYIMNALHSDTDRALFKLLCEARVAGSAQVELLYGSAGKECFVFKESRLENNFSEHTASSYFDFVDLSIVEFAVQAGVYNGSEALFLTGQEQLKVVYGFEPQGNTFFPHETQQSLNDSGKFVLISKGLWNSNSVADFALDGSASFVKGLSDAQNSSTVQLVVLDEELKKLAIPRLDLLIADIENAEIPMLEGAMKCIEQDRPQLAICFYHSKEQFLGIPLMLMKQLKDYIFKIGHYSRGLGESVFYAIPKEKYSGFHSCS